MAAGTGTRHDDYVRGGTVFADQYDLLKSGGYDHKVLVWDRGMEASFNSAWIMGLAWRLSWSCQVEGWWLLMDVLSSRSGTRWKENYFPASLLITRPSTVCVCRGEGAD